MVSRIGCTLLWGLVDSERNGELRSMFGHMKRPAPEGDPRVLPCMESSLIGSRYRETHVEEHQSLGILPVNSDTLPGTGVTLTASGNGVWAIEGAALLNTLHHHTLQF